MIANITKTTKFSKVLFSPFFKDNSQQIRAILEAKLSVDRKKGASNTPCFISFVCSTRLYNIFTETGFYKTTNKRLSISSIIPVTILILNFPTLAVEMIELISVSKN